MTTASRELSGRTSGAFRYGDPLSAEGRDPHVVLALRAVAREPSADRLQECLTFVIDRPKVLADLLDGLRRDRRGPHDLGGPPDLLLDLVQDGPVTADHHPGRQGLD